MFARGFEVKSIWSAFDLLDRFVCGHSDSTVLYSTLCWPISVFGKSFGHPRFSIFATFCAELILKLYAFRGKFFRNGWNVFDFSVIVISIIGMAASITAFRIIRVLRTLRLVTNVPSMRVVIESFLRSIPGILSVVMVLVLMVFVFA